MVQPIKFPILNQKTDVEYGCHCFDGVTGRLFVSLTTLSFFVIQAAISFKSEEQKEHFAK